MTSITAQERYSNVAIALHWAIAALIVFNLSLGFFMEGFRPALRGIVVPLHISSGITVLALTALRVIWRLTHRPPALAADLSAWERISAHAVHLLFYLMMVAMPLTGWAIISAHPPKPVVAMIWGLLPLPQIAPVSHLQASVQHVAHDNFVQIHSILGWITLSLLVLHVAGALKHQLFDRHAELARMGVG